VNIKPTWSGTLKAFLYLLPALAVLAVFHIYPILKSFDVSFYTNYNYYKNIVKARGVDNYVYVVNDPDFWLAMKNTFIFVLGTVPLTIAISLLIALMLNAVGKGKTFFRTIYFLPFVSSMVAVSIVWRWIFHHDYGLMNYMLSLIGVSPVNWLNDPNWAMPSLILLSVWKGLGYNVVLFLAGLQNINQQYIHAGRIDGASKWNRFLHIIVPLLSPTTFFITIISIITSFKVFDEIFSLFGGPGPAQSALTIVFYIYRKFNGEYQYGIAAAAAYALFLVTFVFTLLQLWIGRKRVHY
jgi:multiple sugar transport system permease protein